MGEWTIITMGRPLITERDVIESAKQGKSVILIEPNAIVTAAANDEAKKRNIKISLQQKKLNTNLNTTESKMHESKNQSSNINSINIAIGSDHGGFAMKESLKPFLLDLGYNFIDVGTDSEKACDYPDFAYAVASIVSNDKAKRGIMIDSVGVASSIAANKVPRIRAVACNNEFLARSSREHNDANILTLGGKLMGIELAKSIVKIWLETPYSGGRHQSRLDKIADIENRFLKKS